MTDAPLTARDIAGRLGLDKHPRSWRGDCPACSYSRVFAVREKNGEARLYCANGCAAEDLRHSVENATGGALRPKPKDDGDKAAQRERKRQAALRLFGGSVPLMHRDAAPGRAYLGVRGISAVEVCSDLRFRPDCPHPETAPLPALMALVRDAAGNALALHRTYLKSDGSSKATVEPAKASLGPVWGGAVRLSDCRAGARLVIGEGIESSAAAGIMLGLPAWAALSAGNLGKGLMLPPVIKHIVVAADNDHATAKGIRPGHGAAEEAARRWRREGRHVDIAIPDTEGQDFADVLAERAHG